MKKIFLFIPTVLWLIVAILHFTEGNTKKGIIFLICAIGWAAVEIIYYKSENKNHK